MGASPLREEQRQAAPRAHGPVAMEVAIKEAAHSGGRSRRSPRSEGIDECADRHSYETRLGGEGESSRASRTTNHRHNISFIVPRLQLLHG